MNKILLVNQHVVPIFIDVANALQNESAQVTLLTGHVEKGGVDLSPKIKVINSIRYSRKNTFTRLFTWILFGVHYFFYLAFNSGSKKVVVTTNPPLALVVTYLLAKVTKNPFHIILYDLYPDALVQTNLARADNLLIRTWGKLNGKMFRNAASVITLSESMKEAALRYGAARFTVIPNWADTTYLKPFAKNENEFVVRHQLMDKTVILYSGNMGLTHDLESVVEVAEILKGQESLVFVFIGEGGKKASLMKSAAEKKLKNILFLPYQDARNFPLALASADIGVVTLGQGAEGISVPSKTYSYLAAGLCLLAIAPPDSEVVRLIKQHNVGFCCEPGQTAQLALVVNKLVNDNVQLRGFQQKSRKVSAQFGAENAHLYNAVISGKAT